MTTGREADPYAQGQPYQQYGGQQYGAQQYGAQQYGAPQPGPGQYGAPPARQRNQKGRGWIGITLLVLLVVGIGVGVWFARKGDPDAAAVGDCVSRSGGESVKVVECTDAKATYKIVGKVNNKSQVEFSINSSKICKPFAESKSAYWKGESGGKGYVLCLAPK